jgi:hypothetical protein
MREHVRVVCVCVCMCVCVCVCEREGTWWMGERVYTHGRQKEQFVSICLAAWHAL